MWYDDPRGFLRDDRIARFVPETNTSIESQLNAVMRFSLYLSVIVAVYRRSLAPAVLVLATSAAATYALGRAESARGADTRERMAALELQVDPATKKLCTRPTVDNPYMNVLLSDYSRFPDRPPACDMARADVSDRAEQLAAHNLYVDSDDVYGRRASSTSQFYTNPSTSIPNDQSGFAEWLYRPSPPGRGTCREADGAACAARVFRLYP
jgi:hypothetical protein